MSNYVVSQHKYRLGYCPPTQYGSKATYDVYQPSCPTVFYTCRLDTAKTKVTYAPLTLSVCVCIMLQPLITWSHAIFQVMQYLTVLYYNLRFTCTASSITGYHAMWQTESMKVFVYKGHNCYVTVKDGFCGGMFFTIHQASRTLAMTTLGAGMWFSVCIDVSY